LIRNGFPKLFQAYDEGSIPFTRFSKIKDFRNRHLPRIAMRRSWEEKIRISLAPR